MEHGTWKNISLLNNQDICKIINNGIILARCHKSKFRYVNIIDFSLNIFT